MRRALLGTLLAATSAVFAFYFLAPIPDPLFEPDYATIVTDRRGEALRVYLNGDEQWVFPPDPAVAIPPRLRQTVITFEDRYFYIHPGVNPGAILRAAYQNLTTGTRVSGASTITMQLARLIETKERTLRNKILEAIQALAIEMRYDKEEILRLYLDHAPYGGNIRGFRAAARKYFGKAPFDLTWAEAATLTVLPNKPRLAPGIASSEELSSRRDGLLRRLRDRGVIAQADFELALAEPVPTSVRVFPVAAPHAADLARARGDGFVIETTIDATLQRRLESMVTFHARYLETEGVDNVSAIVVDTATAEVAAYVGSQDYFDYSVRGHIDGIQAPRSTGSILKPFLYSLAMDEGMLIADSLLKDVPTQIGAYAPQNIDRRFRGLVSAEQALVRSLNVPAVRLLAEYGLESFYYFLKDAGLAHLFRRPEDYGLPLILGGAEATPFELAALYRGLAAGGVFAPVRLLPDGGRSVRQSAGLRLLSEGASYLTLEMLQEVRRPGAEAYWRAFEGGVPVAWKTGTSYGRRDAWAVGVSPRWTVVVWAGNFTGEGSANLSSTTGAGYLLFEIFNAFSRNTRAAQPPAAAQRAFDGHSAGPTTAGATDWDADTAKATTAARSQPAQWFSPPAGSLREIETCLVTGYRATDHCEVTAPAVVPAGAPPLRPCPYHETIYVTLDGQHRVDSRCWRHGEYRRASVLVFPPEIADYARSSGLEASRVPPWSEDCGPGRGISRVTIAYPDEGARIFLPRELDGSLQKLTVRAAHRDSSARLYWYVDTSYVGATEETHKVSLELERGRYTVTCVDDAGARASVSFVVDIEEE